MRRTPVSVAAILAGLLLVSGASASPIVYTFSGSGTGSIGGINFSDASFAITVEADTVGIAETMPGLFVNPASTAQIQIAGFGLATFTTGKAVFSNQNADVLGFTNATGNVITQDLLDLFNSAFGSYDLSGLIAPVFQAVPFKADEFVGIPTSLGDVTFTSIADVTFNAQPDLANVPEPATVTIWALSGLGYLAARRWRSRRRLAA